MDRLRGREAQLELAGDLLDAVGRGDGGVLLIEGAPGIGKTRLLDGLASMARRARVRVVRGQAFDGGWAVPFAPLLGALLDGGLFDRAALRGLNEQTRFWLLEELQTTLEAAALGEPLIVILDDLQWADSGTLVALAEVTSRLRGTPIVWALARRSGETGPQLHRLFAHLEEAGGTRIDLHGLSDHEVAGVVRDRFDAQPSAGLLGLSVGAQGNPFWLAELLDGLAEEDRVRLRAGVAHVDGATLPARVAQSMRERLDSLSDETRQLVRVAALLGLRFSVGHLAAALRRTPIELVAALEEARQADLVDEFGERFGFRHDLVREAVLATLPRTMRREIQRELSQLLLADGAAPIDVAAYVAESAETGDMEAVRVLRDAARSVRLTDGSVAADLGRRALEVLPSTDPSHPSLTAETLLMLHAAMRYEEADELAAAALANDLEPQLEAELRLSLSAMIMRGAGSRAEHNRRALLLDGVSEDLRVKHRLWLAHNLASHGPLDEAQAAAPDAVAAARESGARWASSLAELVLTMIECRSGRLGDALVRMEREARTLHAIEDPLVASLVRFHHGNLLGALGRIDDAMAIYRENVARSQRERQAYDLYGWVAVGSRLHLSAGRLADAAADAEAGEAMTLSSAPMTLPGASALVARAQIALHTGDAVQLEAAVDVARRVVRTGSLVMRIHARWTLALAAFAAGDPRAAARWLTNDEEVPYAVPVLPTDPAFHVQAARIAVAAGDDALAAYARHQLEQLERAGPGVPLIAGLAAHARGLLDEDAAQLQRAAEILRTSQRPLVLASALEDAGRVRGRDGAARLLEALELYEAAGATGDARRVARHLRERGVRRRLAPEPRPAHGWNSLTESELRVVALVGAGATNRDVAARLVLSPHTVSTHLRHAFAKLDINSRVELARIVAQRELHV